MSWPVVKLSEVAHINPRLPKDIDDSQLVTFVAMASASEDGRLLGYEERVLSDTKKGFTYFDRDDVLLAKITPCFENGKCLRPGQIPHDIGFGSTEFHVIRPISGVLDGLYAFYMVWNEQFRFLGEKSMSGAAGQKRVSAEFLRESNIPLPPLTEQKRIAAILDAADALRAKRRESIALLDSLLQSTFLEMFGDPVANPMGWDTSTVGDCAVKVTDGDHHTPKRTDSGIKLLSARNVLDGEIDLTNTDFVGKQEYERMIKRCHPEIEDILISCSGSIGRVARIRFVEPIVLVRSAALVKPDKSVVEPVFMEHLLRTQQLRSKMLQLAKSSSQANLFQQPIRSLPMLVPPLELQQQFAAVVESIERQKARLRAHLAELDALFASLQSRAFNGEL